MNDFDKLFPSKYMLATEEIKPFTATVVKAYVGKIGKPGEEDERGMVEFQDQEKPLVLNKTNFVSIAEIAGSHNMADWPGTVVEIFSIYGEFFGQMQHAVRIRRPSGPQAEAKPAGDPIA